MRGFDLDQLRTFAAVADAGSLTAAAPRLHLSQSTVSEQVRKLEARAGVPLFVRSKRGVEATPAGNRLLHHARRIVALNEAAFDELRGQAIKGELRVAITDYYRTHEVAGLLARLRECYPQLSLHVSAMKSAEIEHAHAKGQIDIGVVMNLSSGPFRPMSGDTRWVLRREPLSWVTSPALAEHLPEPLPLVLLPDDCIMHQVAIRSLEEQRVPFVLVHSASGVAGLQSMLAAGLGVGCLCASAIGDGLMRLGAKYRLPALPDAVFSLTPPLPGEREAVTQAREVLARQLLV
ncbi:LysR family transcriptional regulator [Burkholderia stagnalis]|uniref:LysR family transcriptional regulator n=1 Tax=Burkholderia stagnalis TaxID=1503054 RepID=UPI000F591A52|nr:LysR family transcriptional regulator [Burkholderia stagnalis]RQQ10867.1 LysR family transcriptional regulator [Burkholderia stagnalis]RQQ37836.1 LysR family transcriptional regulator [Burkholderia stagnalis]RQY27717.1 LysR family transcriptional regulator [Burkholderia stagnalis]RQY41624.1 LysR family transcriptional regulator [Burkholderia stagnalis]RQY60892.1 LysR family transcriptional regulator [Burkholderia stagnalis]